MDLLLHELRRNLGDALRTPFRPAIIDRDGATVSPTEFAQSLDKSTPIWTVGRSVKEHERDGRPLARLLCPGGRRARDRYAAKKR
jgi:hypothetical protein